MVVSSWSGVQISERNLAHPFPHRPARIVKAPIIDILVAITLTASFSVKAANAAPSHVKPVEIPVSLPAVPKVIKPLPPPTEQPMAEVEPLPEPVAQAPVEAPQPVYTPPAASATGGCVTGYSTGDIYLNKIIAYESGGNSCATNPGGCFGLLQACPGSPLRAACGGDPDCQIAWFQANKTGGRSWAQVWQHELDYGWW